MGCQFRYGFYKDSELYKHGRQGFLLFVVAKVWGCFELVSALKLESDPKPCTQPPSS